MTTTTTTPKVQYLLFDIESVADADLVARVHFQGAVPRDEAIDRYRAELRDKNGSDFIPYTYQVPISLAILRICSDFTIDAGESRPDPLTVLSGEPHVIADTFWSGCLGKYLDTTLVTFNGRSFDLPLLELAAFRYGISIPKWFRGETRPDPRYRYSSERHLDLYDKLTNFGATRFAGGLNLAATLLGKPGKMNLAGHMVQDKYNAGALQEIHDYCCCDVLDTYFVFLRVMLMSGRLTLDEEQQLVARAKTWLEQKRDAVASAVAAAVAAAAADSPSPASRAYELYLQGWGDWPNPWNLS